METPPVHYEFLEAKEYYDKSEDGGVTARTLLRDLHRAFRTRILDVIDLADAKREKNASSSESSDESEPEEKNQTVAAKRKPFNARADDQRKIAVPVKNDPGILHNDLSFNEKNRLNDGKACRCKKVLRGYGTKHGHLVGDEQQKFVCEPRGNNLRSLFCYRIRLAPVVNFDSAQPTILIHNGKQFTFQGFCLLSHQKLDQYPSAQTIRFNVSYTATLESIPLPSNFVVEDLRLLKEFLFGDVLELKDWRMKAESLDSDKKICDFLHFLPLFVRTTATCTEVAPMSSVLDHIVHEFRLIFNQDDAAWLKTTSQSRFEEHVQRFRGSLVVIPGRKPAAVRVDQIDRDIRDIAVKDRRDKDYPALVHFTTRCSNAFDQNFNKSQRKLDQMRSVMENKPRDQVSAEERMRCCDQQRIVDEMRSRLNVKREVTVVLSSREFHHSGLRSDIAQYGLLMPVVIFHYRFHVSLDTLEQKLGYSFRDRNLLELALTHPSYRSNLGTNPDHIRNAQANLGLRKTAYGQNGAIPKSGMKTLIHTMAQLGAEDEIASPIKNYERLEFLGDAVLEFLTSVRLFLMFPDFQEGSLATFRSTLVQNNHLATLAEPYSLSHFLLLSHGREVSSRNRITDRHATANCFEAICGAIYLDNGIKHADEFISKALGSRLFGSDEQLCNAWRYPNAHISQTQYPTGDRHLIEKHELLQRVAGFEQISGIYFNHIRLLANAFSSRQVHDNPITIGNNQRLEFLGDTVLQLIVSDYLFKHFPSHHEGHLSLLRSSLVKNETQALVCDELGMRRFLIKEPTVTKDGHVPDIKMKDKADLVEAFLGALYLDKGLTVSEAFCNVVFFPKLPENIVTQSWSDPKSRLQQLCLTLRSFEKGPPKLPEYKMINKEGPSNNRKYEVAVYFRDERLASGVGSNTKQAENAAADAALKNPIFQPDFQRQQDFAKRAVAAQNHQSRLGHKQNGFSDRSRAVFSVPTHRTSASGSERRKRGRDDENSSRSSTVAHLDKRNCVSHSSSGPPPSTARSNGGFNDSRKDSPNGIGVRTVQRESLSHHSSGLEAVRPNGNYDGRRMGLPGGSGSNLTDRRNMMSHDHGHVSGQKAPSVKALHGPPAFPSSNGEPLSRPPPPPNRSSRWEPQTPFPAVIYR